MQAAAEKHPVFDHRLQGILVIQAGDHPAPGADHRFEHQGEPQFFGRLPGGGQCECYLGPGNRQSGADQGGGGLNLVAAIVVDRRAVQSENPKILQDTRGV